MTGNETAFDGYKFRYFNCGLDTACLFSPTKLIVPSVDVKWYNTARDILFQIDNLAVDVLNIIAEYLADIEYTIIMPARNNYVLYKTKNIVAPHPAYYLVYVEYDDANNRELILDIAANTIYKTKIAENPVVGMINNTIGDWQHYHSLRYIIQ